MADEKGYQRMLDAERRRAKTLLRKFADEYDEVPKIPRAENVEMGGDSLLRGLTTLTVILNDSIRSLRGKDTSQQMRGKISELKSYLAEARRLKSSLSPGPESLTSPRDSSDVPRGPRFNRE